MYQWVNLRRGGELVKMSTRKASFVTVDEVLARSAATCSGTSWSSAARTRTSTSISTSPRSAPIATRCTRSSTRTRGCAASRARPRRTGSSSPADPAGLPLHRLVLPDEIELAKLVGRWPEAVQHAADAREPQEIARFLLELANAFNAYVSDGKRHRVVSDDRELSQARLALVSAVRITLASGLALLGIGAPERM